MKSRECLVKQPPGSFKHLSSQSAGQSVSQPVSQPASPCLLFFCFLVPFRLSNWRETGTATVKTGPRHRKLKQTYTNSSSSSSSSSSSGGGRQLHFDTTSEVCSCCEGVCTCILYTMLEGRRMVAGVLVGRLGFPWPVIRCMFDTYIHPLAGCELRSASAGWPEGRRCCCCLVHAALHCIAPGPAVVVGTECASKVLALPQSRRPYRHVCWLSRWLETYGSLHHHHYHHHRRQCCPMRHQSSPSPTLLRTIRHTGICSVRWGRDE